VGRSILRPRLYVSTSDQSRSDDPPQQRYLGRRTLANVYIEARPKGRPEGSPIEDYVVEDHSDNVLATFKTQREAIDWALRNGHTPR
jgi:hypothetical protein